MPEEKDKKNKWYRVEQAMKEPTKSAPFTKKLVALAKLLARRGMIR